MKKTLAFGLGLTLLGATIIPFTSASRDAYHVYLYQQGRQVNTPQEPQLKQRNFSQRMGAYSRSRVAKRDTETLGVNPSRNTRYSQSDIRNIGAISRTSLTQDYRLMRPVSDRVIGGTQLNSHRLPQLKLKANVDAIDKFLPYENEKFSLEIPFGWRATNDNPHAFVHPRSDYTITVRHIDKVCTNTGFMACAITLSKDQNHKNPAEKIAITGPISRQSHFYGTVLNETIQTRTYTESFSAEVLGKDIYIARHFIADLEGGVYIIETKTALENADIFLGVSKNVFDSFQIFPLEK